MKNRSLCIFSLFLAIIIFMTGCGCSASNKEMVMKEIDLPIVPFFSEEVSIEYGVLHDITDEMEWTKKAKKLERKFQISVMEICQELCDFLNQKYQLDWQAKKIEAYASEVTKGLEGNNTLTYGACYYEGKIFIDRAFIKSEVKGQIRYIVAHELLHYLYETNAKRDQFSEKKSKNRFLGIYLEEAFVDSLAREYMLSQWHEVNVEDLKSGYSTVRLYVDLMALAVPDLYQYFLKNDIEGLKKAIDKQAKQHVYCVGSPFDKWAWLIDQTLYSKGNTEYMSELASIVISFSTVITPSKKADKFVSRLEEEKLDGKQYIQFMY